MYFISTEAVDNLVTLAASEEAFPVENLQDPLGSARWRSTGVTPYIYGQFASAKTIDAWGAWYTNARQTDWARLRLANSQGDLTAAPLLDQNAYVWPGAAGFFGAVRFTAGSVAFGDVLKNQSNTTFSVQLRIRRRQDLTLNNCASRRLNALVTSPGWLVRIEADDTVQVLVCDGVISVGKKSTAAVSNTVFETYTFVVDRTAQLLRVYRGAAEQGSGASLAALGSTLSNEFFYLGRHAAGGLATVDLDEFRFWSKALSPAEIAANYNAELNVVTPPANLELYWRANEGTGTAATDESGFGRHGTITNGTWLQTVPYTGPDLSRWFDPGQPGYVHQRSVIASPVSAFWWRMDFDYTGNPDGYVEVGVPILAERFTPARGHEWGPRYRPNTRAAYSVEYAAGGLGRGGGTFKRDHAFRFPAMGVEDAFGEFDPMIRERRTTRPVGVVLVEDEATYPMNYLYYGYLDVAEMPHHFLGLAIDCNITEP